MSNKTPIIGLIIFSLFITALITRNGDIAWMMLPFISYLGVGVLRTPVLERMQFVATRTLEQDQLSGIAAIHMNLKIQNQTPETICLHVEEKVQAEMKITNGDLSRWMELRRGETAELKYTFTAVRGSFSWDSIRIVVSDPLNLMETEMFLPAAAMIQVRPQIKKFKTIPFRPRSTLHSPGSIPSHLGGSGINFFGVREYQPGDSLRRLNWRLTARHPRKFFTREFEQEEIADIGLLLDARQRTELKVGEESLFEACVGATASLAEMFLHQGHRVSLLVFGETMLNTFPGYGKAQLHRIMSCLSRAKVEEENITPPSLDFIPTRAFPNHALIIVISSITSADWPLFLRLRACEYQVLLISPDAIDFAHPILKDDMAGRFAVRAALIERRLLLNKVSRLQIPVIDWRISQPLFPLVRNALAHSRGRQNP